MKHAYDARGRSPRQPRPREDRPLTTRRAIKSQTSAGKAEEAPIHGPGRGGRDRRTAQEYARDLASETERSLLDDPERHHYARASDRDEHRAKPQRPGSRPEIAP